jgi:type 1 fimbria pilin
MKCNLKYSLVAAALCLMAGAAQAQQATVSVTGRITNTACTLSVDNVTMGDVPISEYASASVPSTAYRKNFNITLGGCLLSTLTSASLKFTGTTISGDTSTLALSGSGVAQGFGVRISSNDSFHGSSASVVFGTSVFNWNLASNRTVYQFQAYYYKYGTTAKPGTANASATVTLTYA